MSSAQSSSEGFKALFASDFFCKYGHTFLFVASFFSLIILNSLSLYNKATKMWLQRKKRTYHEKSYIEQVLRLLTIMLVRGNDIIVLFLNLEFQSLWL